MAVRCVTIVHLTLMAGRRWIKRGKRRARIFATADEHGWGSKDGDGGLPRGDFALSLGGEQKKRCGKHETQI